MIRKTFHIFLILSLVISTAGITFSKHFCNNEVVSYHLKSDVEPCCEDMTCCHNEKVTIDKISDFIVADIDLSLNATSKKVLASPVIQINNYTEVILRNMNYSYFGLSPNKSINILSKIQVFRL